MQLPLSETLPTHFPCGLSLDATSSRKPSLPSSKAGSGHCAASPIIHSTDASQCVSPEARDWVWSPQCPQAWPGTWHSTVTQVTGSEETGIEAAPCTL